MDVQPTNHNPQPVSVVAALVVGCLSLITFVGIAHAYTFTRDLTLGSKGEDVRQLQIELNRYPSTQVAYTGIGSPGQETDYFGPKTHAAVIRYQNLYASTILEPIGLTRGTGYVGPTTRAQLSGVATASYTTTYTTPITPAPTPTAAIPNSRAQMEISLEEFSGTDTPTDTDVREYARTMVFASQGYNYTPQKGSTSSGTSGNTSSTMSGSSSSGGSSGSSNGSTSSSTRPTRADADEESGLSTGGCADLLLSIFGL
jgi:uncharacterized membrane protein YgcG